MLGLGLAEDGEEEPTVSPSERVVKMWCVFQVREFVEVGEGAWMC